MTVEELVAEGDAFRVAFPRASARGIRAHLEKLIDPDPADERDRAADAATDGPEGCLGWLLLLPVVGMMRGVRRWRHRRRVSRAMRVLFPKGRG
jgi:hypothetical protein